MLSNRFLRNRCMSLTDAEHKAIDGAVSQVVQIGARKTISHTGDHLRESTLLIEGFMCRYIDDRQGLRQLVAIHVPGDFVDLHGYPLTWLDHDVATLTQATIAQVPHGALDRILEEQPTLARKLWFSTLMDAAVHRSWLFRLGRLDAMGRIAHFLCEMNARLHAVGLSDGKCFALGITQYDLSEACGITSIHANRVLKQLREEGLCTFRGQACEIHDPVALARRGQFTPDYLYLDFKAEAQSPEA